MAPARRGSVAPAAAAQTPSAVSSSSSSSTLAGVSPQILPADTSFTYPASYAQTEPFTRPHTVGVLLTLICAFIYALYSEAMDAAANKVIGGDLSAERARQHNIARGVTAAAALGLTFCTEHLRDTLFVRPHPAVWRFVTGCGLIYAMALSFSLFQNLDDLRALMVYLDPVHSGKALPEKSYGESCDFTWSNVSGATDEFVVAHLLGWAFKATMIRDVKISMLISFLFELMEYTFTYLQPNFNECWWDHWILDFGLCNTGGILLGHAFMLWQDSREYNWVGLNDVPTVSGKLHRLAQQFTPRSWVHYEWHMFEDIRRFGYVFFLIVGVMICELDAFFLKFILRLQPPSPLNVYRLVIWWAVGMVALRDYYAFITDPKIKRLGSTCWVILAVLLTELAVVVKFGVTLPEWQGKVPPPIVVYGWGAVFLVGLVGLAYWFLVELPARRSAGARAAAAAIASAGPTSAKTGKAADAKEEAEEEAEEEAAAPARGRKGKAAAAAGGKGRARSTAR